MRLVGVETIPKSASYHEILIEDLKDLLEAASYIEVVLEEGDFIMLSKVLRNFIEAQGGIDRFSSQVQQCYQTLDRMLLEKGKIEFVYLSSLLDALGLQLAVLFAVPRLLFERLRDIAVYAA